MSHNPLTRSLPVASALSASEFRSLRHDLNNALTSLAVNIQILVEESVDPDLQELAEDLRLGIDLALGYNDRLREERPV